MQGEPDLTLIESHPLFTERGRAAVALPAVLAVIGIYSQMHADGIAAEPCEFSGVGGIRRDGHERGRGYQFASHELVYRLCLLRIIAEIIGVDYKILRHLLLTLSSF